MPQSFFASTRDALSIYFHKRVLILLLLGFSAGLPLMLVFSTLSFWLREAGVDRAAIGYFSWVALIYAFKWAWSPLVDRMPLPLFSQLFGRRRGWMLFSQLLLIAAILGMAGSDPMEDLTHLALFALMVAFSSATQDIVVDAFRIESAPEKMQAALAAAYQVGYRSAMIIATAGSLTIAAWVSPEPESYDLQSWQTAYLVMAGLMGIGILATLFAKEPAVDISSIGEEEAVLRDRLRANLAPRLSVWAAPANLFILRHGKLLLLLLGLYFCFSLAEPFTQVLQSYFPSQALNTNVVTLATMGLTLLLWLLIFGVKSKDRAIQEQEAKQLTQAGTDRMAAFISWLYSAVALPFIDFFRRYGKSAILILMLISCYRISDIVMGIMANVFYVDMGFSKEEIATLSKVYGLIMTLVGSAFGGVLLARFGTIKILYVGAFLVATTNLLFALQAMVGYNVPLLTLAISVDNFSGGIATAAFIAYLSSLTSSGYSATQYALLSSVMLLFPKFIAGFSGAWVNAFGYVNFFVSASIIGLPVLLLIWLVQKNSPPRRADTAQDTLKSQIND
ncbi:MFS transporter [Shewanella sp. MSW]|uniref:MFS transporter n=1 Tax=Shewanella sp. MSW TaxID=2569536 RepID=UPI001186F3F3|nr:MFS transporter [Shewanella sp. MSW]TVP10257.1 hypothetical protein AYI96_13230 [Shewanella sp. MSW]